MKSKKIISILLTALTVLSVNPISAFAQSSIGSTSSNILIGEDVEQKVKTQYEEIEEGNTQTQVYLTVEDSDLVVSVPTTIILSGTPDTEGNYIGEYSVGVSGNMSGDKNTIIKPEKSHVDLIQKGKRNRDAIITQEKTEFDTIDFSNNTITTGIVTSTGLTAGNWNGSATFLIYQEDLNKKINYTTATPEMFSGVQVFRNQLMLTKYTGDNSDLYVPSTMAYNNTEYPVLLNGNVFGDNTTIKNVLFAENIYLFGENANLFRNATNLETALIENNSTFANPEVKTNMIYEFSGCPNLKEIYSLEQYTDGKIFQVKNSNLINTIPQNVTKVEIVSDNIRNIPSIPSNVENLSIVSSSLSGDIIIQSEKITNFSISSVAIAPYINSQIINIKCPNNSLTMTNVLKYIANGRHTVTVESLDGSELQYNKIYALGDSLTAGNYYIYQLNSLIGSNNVVYNYGVESDTANNLLNRIGKTNITISQEFTIPASTMKVPIQLSQNYCNEEEKVGQDTAGINCVTINGVLGFITYEKGVHYFERAYIGKATHCCKGTSIVTEFQNSYKKGEKLIIYIGTNDLYGIITNSRVDELANKIQAIVDYCECNDYIVVGVAFRQNVVPCSNETMAYYDEIMEHKFGNKYLNLRQYFIDNAYTICPELDCDTTEQEELSKGIVPMEFFYDNGTHWEKTTGGKVVAQAIYDKLTELDYLK